jgi:PAS domain-containing protein
MQVLELKLKNNGVGSTRGVSPSHGEQISLTLLAPSIDGSFRESKLIFRPAQAESRPSLRDITERRLAEEALRKSEERFSKAFRSSPLAVTISTEAGGRRAQNSYTVSKGDARGKPSTTDN